MWVHEQNFQLIVPILAKEHARFICSVKMQQKSYYNHEGTNIIEYTLVSLINNILLHPHYRYCSCSLLIFIWLILTGKCYQVLSIFSLVFRYTIPPGICKEAEACRAGSHYVHYTQTKWLEGRRTRTWTPKQHIQSRHVPQEPHTNQDGTSLCILPYLNISDFLWLEVYFRLLIVFPLDAVTLYDLHPALIGLLQ